MRVGAWQVLAVLEGTFGLDGGSMFGIVPRALWSRQHPPDEQNRISMALRALLIFDDQRRILVDTGIGERFRGKQKDIYRHERRQGGTIGGLARLGFAPEDITDVVATHLHFDHVGGMLTEGSDGVLRPTFPRAAVHLQEDCWAWSRDPSTWDRASYFSQDFAIWEKELDLRFLQGDRELFPGVHVNVTEGHMPGHQVVRVGQGTGSVVFCADLIPTSSHVRLPYIMAYDHQPLRTLEEKKILLAQALEEDWVLVFEHDPYTVACRLTEKDGQVLPGERSCLNTKGEEEQ